MSFVFDQIDAIENQRSQKDHTLQRIRAWRQSKTANQNPENVSYFETNAISTATLSTSTEPLKLAELTNKDKLEVVMVHPWPEWIELMERLVQQNYLDHRRKDEDKMVQDLGFDISGVADEVDFDFTRDFKTVQTACLNFGKDRFDIFRSLSRQDIQIMVGYGCPSADKKVVFSAKLLRKHAHLDEGDVCSSCSLRSSCERAYLLTNKEDEAQTIDIMRVLLTFGFDPINGSVVNKSLMKQKSVKTVIRKLLHEVVKLSAVPIDPNLPPPIIKRPPPKVKQPPPPPRKRVGRDDVEMKKGDWLCPKCDFMNFAKNTVCLQCDAKRPKRQLLPGEWECPECNFLNYRRNMACFHCECKRPPDEFMENKSQERQNGPRTRFDKLATRPEVSNAWNFNFDDDESDGADVAAFEHADSSARDANSLSASRAQGGNLRGSEDNLSKTGTVPTLHEREYSDLDTDRPGTGFDDFDDEDDVESYELDTQNNNPIHRTSSKNISAIECFSELENNDGSDDNLYDRRRTAKPFNSQIGVSGSGDDEQDFDSDEDLSVHPKWKSSHVADSRNKSRGRGPTRSSKQLSFGSDEEHGLCSEMDDDSDDDVGSRKSKGGKWGSERRDIQRRGRSFDIEDGPYSGSKFDNHNSRSKEESGRRGNGSRGQGRNQSSGNRRNSFNDEYNRSSHGNDRGFGRGDNNSGRRAQLKSKDSGGNRRKSFSDDFNRLSHGNDRKYRDEFNRPSGGGNRGSRRESRHNDKGNGQGRRYNEHDTDMDKGEPRRIRIIER